MVLSTGEQWWNVTDAFVCFLKDRAGIVVHFLLTQELFVANYIS